MKYSPDEAKVIRDGRAVKVHASEVVPGDIITVSVGDKIPADARVISITSASFTIDQALLTGESQSVSKIVESVKDQGAVKQDMINMLFSVSLKICRTSHEHSIYEEINSFRNLSISGNDSGKRNSTCYRHLHRDPNRHRRYSHLHHFANLRKDPSEAKSRRFRKLVGESDQCHLFVGLGCQSWKFQ